MDIYIYFVFNILNIENPVGFVPAGFFACTAEGTGGSIRILLQKIFVCFKIKLRK